MKDSSINRWLWLIGLLAAAMFFVSFGPLSSGSPNENASGTSVAHWYNTHVNQQWLTIWLVGLGLFLLLVYVTQLRTVLIRVGGERLWPNITFASGILLVAGIIVARAASRSRSSWHRTITSSQWRISSTSTARTTSCSSW